MHTSVPACLVGDGLDMDLLGTFFEYMLYT